MRLYISRAWADFGWPHSSTAVTAKFSSASLRATTKPSPPLLPLPQRITAVRPDRLSRVRIRRAAALPAFSISRR